MRSRINYRQLVPIALLLGALVSYYFSDVLKDAGKQWLWENASPECYAMVYIADHECEAFLHNPLEFGWLFKALSGYYAGLTSIACDLRTVHNPDYDFEVRSVDELLFTKTIGKNTIIRSFNTNDGIALLREIEFTTLKGFGIRKELESYEPGDFAISMGNPTDLVNPPSNILNLINSDFVDPFNVPEGTYFLIMKSFGRFEMTQDPFRASRPDLFSVQALFTFNMDTDNIEGYNAPEEDVRAGIYDKGLYTVFKEYRGHGRHVFVNAFFVDGDELRIVQLHPNVLMDSNLRKKIIVPLFTELGIPLQLHFSDLAYGPPGSYDGSPHAQTSSRLNTDESNPAEDNGSNETIWLIIAK